MARLARLVIPGLPHHVTQRGNGRAQTFFQPEDYALYRDLLATACRAAEVEVWAWVLMPNHVHLILVPADAAGLGRAVGEAHRRYTNFVNGRGRWSGHLFQSRFASVAMDEAHLIAAVGYVSLNPVRARLVGRAQEWPWSSVRAHLAGADDELVTARPVLERVERFADLLEAGEDEAALRALRNAETTGRPLGAADFIADLEQRLGRPLARRAPGRKARVEAAEQLDLLT